MTCGQVDLFLNILELDTMAVLQIKDKYKTRAFERNSLQGFSNDKLIASV